ncbi:macrophage mannose receptor 1-like [Centropristis striata]|uniref:macrophage mannose receptor 1-like n=1 Tax=Centropristis striata TaxID=184440 RepID=UPI0027E15CB6|nr:macrophage mannose receptor 1-like [Centropristis striata]
MTERRLIVMKGTQTFYLLFISGLCSYALGSSEFHLNTVSKTYADAKTYCREMYSDLATVHNSTDMDSLIALVPNSILRAWIGLEIGDVRTWHWSQSGQQLGFLNWREGEPQAKDEDACGAMDQHGKWFESDCGVKRQFVCHGNSDNRALTFVAETKSWRDAQKHCRDLSSDLISIHSAEENEAVRNVSMSQNMWLGLFRDPWKWSDGSNSSFRYWNKGNLILIQENKTWSEALSYCRQHHVDLVHITTEHIQGTAAETAKNATSAHVWLGLRYTCKFNFWFWTKFSPGCYQNWAPGQGPEGKYGCGVTGAIESTGRQQWVGLSETETLNFICSTCTG